MQQRKTRLWMIADIAVGAAALRDVEDKNSKADNVKTQTSSGAAGRERCGPRGAARKRARTLYQGAIAANSARKHSTRLACALATGLQGGQGPAGANGANSANGANGNNGFDGADEITGMAISVPANPGGITGTYNLVLNGTAMIDSNTASDRLTGIEIDVDGTPLTNTNRAEFSTSTTEMFVVATTRTVTGLSAASSHNVSLLSCSNGNLMTVLANGASLSAFATG